MKTVNLKLQTFANLVCLRKDLLNKKSPAKGGFFYQASEPFVGIPPAGLSDQVHPEGILRSDMIKNLEINQFQPLFFPQS